MLEKIVNELKNEKMNFGTLDSKMMKFGYASVCGGIDVEMVLESGSVVFEYPEDFEEGNIVPVEIFFILEDKELNDIHTNLVITEIAEYN